MKRIKSIVNSTLIGLLFVTASFSAAEEGFNTDSLSVDFLDSHHSSSMMSGEFIERSIMRELSDSFRAISNISIADSVDSGYLIRGINSEGNGLLPSKPLSHIYVDGIAQSLEGARRGSLGTWDLDSVTLLRGPQGTAGGRVSTSGQINIQTKNPTFDEEGSLLFGLGENNLYESALMVSGPINEYLAARFTAEILDHDGEFNYPLSEGLPKLSERKEDKYYQLRAKILYQPSGENGPQAKLTASHSYDAPQYQDVDGPSAGVDWQDRIWGLQSLPAFIPAISTEVSQANLSIFKPINEYWSIESLSGIVRTHTEFPSIDLSKNGKIEEETISRQIKGIYQKGLIKSSAGIFYLDGEMNHSYDQKLPFNDFRSRNYENVEIENLALFGEMDLQILPRWSLFGGLRYDHEKLGYSRIYRDINDNEVINSKFTSQSSSADAILPKIGINYKINENNTIGLKSQKSYRAGGMKYDLLNDSEYEYKDEKVWNYELSLSGKSPDKKINYSANLFYMDWKDQQVNIPQIPGDSSTAIISNVNDSQVYGGELEIQAKANEDLTLFTSLGAAVTEFEDFKLNQFRTETILSGEKFPRSPNFTASVGFEYQFESGFFLGADMKYTSSRVSRSIFEGLERDDLPEYTILNLRLGYRQDDWSITAFASNLTNEEYFLYRYDTPKLQVGTIGLERYIGLRVTYNF
ncbi:TonB-dependent receptor [Verrucomicrobiales bacterium]|nr:TonB-dependent receptor [Verrucomicrobiales bacterium]